MNVLLLNASLEPLQTISVRRAVNLLLAEKVQAVSQNGYHLRTVNTIFTVPFMVRLLYYVNAPRKDVVWSRQAVLERDDWQCVLGKHTHPRPRFSRRTHRHQRHANAIGDEILHRLYFNDDRLLPHFGISFQTA